MADENSGWNLLKLIAVNERRALTLGTIRVASQRIKPDTKKREYGGRPMSVSRAKAYGPTRQYVAQKTSDITG